MRVDQRLFYTDASTKDCERVQELRLFDTETLDPDELVFMSTYIDPRRIECYGLHRDIRDNPYCMELCRRAGNIDKFMYAHDEKESRRCADNAARSFGFELI